MKMRWIFTGILLLNLITAYSQTGTGRYAKLTFIGSHGFLIETANKKIMIDAVSNYIYHNGYSYIAPPIEVVNKVQNAEAPFDSVDLFFVSHAHEEHYEADMLEDVMLRNDSAALFTTQAIKDAVATSADSMSVYEDRICVPQMAYNQSIDTIINDISITATKILHSGSMDLLILSFEVDSIRFLQINSFSSLTTQDYDTMGFNDNTADVGLICYGYFMDATKYNMFDTYLHPDYTLICHVDGASTSRLGILQGFIEDHSPEHPMGMLDVSMESIGLTVYNDTVIVDTINQAPVLSINIPDTTIMTNVAFSYILPENIFTDPEGDPVTIKVKRTASEELPSWLSYNPATRELSGTPTAMSTNILKVYGFDEQLAAFTDNFIIRVKVPSDISTPEIAGFDCYPNPSEGLVYINCGTHSSGAVTVNVYSTDGCMVMKKIFLNPGEIINMDLSSLPGSLYILKISTNEQSVLKKIFISK